MEGRESSRRGVRLEVPGLSSEDLLVGAVSAAQPGLIRKGC